MGYDYQRDMYKAESAPPGYIGRESYHRPGIPEAKQVLACGVFVVVVAIALIVFGAIMIDSKMPSSVPTTVAPALIPTGNVINVASPTVQQPKPVTPTVQQPNKAPVAPKSSEPGPDVSKSPMFPREKDGKILYYYGCDQSLVGTFNGRAKCIMVKPLFGDQPVWIYHDSNDMPWPKQ